MLLLKSEGDFNRIWAGVVSKNNNLSIVVQAGGESRRMGRSKACVPFLGRPLIWRSIERLLPLADEFIITTNEPEKLDFLSELTGSGKISLVTDTYEERGALRGIYSAISAASKEYVSLIACDMVFPSPNLIMAELEALMETGADVAVPKTQFGYEPFHGVYKKDTCLPVIYKEIEQGTCRAAGWFDKIKVEIFNMDMVLAAEPEGRCFINVNTPQELYKVEQKIIHGIYS